MSKSPLTDVEVHLELMTSTLASQIKVRYNLIGIKSGYAHVATSSDAAVNSIAPMLGYSSEQERSAGNSIFLCWIAVPIDEGDYCIKTDSKEQEDKVNQHPDSSIERILAKQEFFRHVTSIDEVEEVLSRHLKCRVFAGLYAIMEGDIKYRRLSWLFAAQN